MTTPRRRGRSNEPLTGPGERALLGLFGLLFALGACWHLALWAGSTGLGIGDSPATFRALLKGHPLAGLGKGVQPPSTGLAVVLWVGFLAVLIALAAVGFRSWRRQSAARPGEGMAMAADARQALGVRRARSAARFTRPDAFTGEGGDFSARAAARAPLMEFGVQIGTQHGTGEPLVATPEDSIAVVAPSGAGKSRTLVVPVALQTPGPLVVTGTRADVLDVIHQPRSAVGRVWVFDPLQTVGWPERMVWDPVAGCADGETAMSRAKSMTFGLGAGDSSGTNSGFFRKTAESALTRLLHAADLSGRHIDTVMRWTTTLERNDEPRAILADHPRAEPGWEYLLRSVSTGADETVSSTRQTLASEIEPMMLRKVLACVTPQPGVPTFDADAFVASSDTLVLISDANASTNVAPLTTMLLGEVVDAAKRRAKRSPSGRLDPFLRLVLDEVANVAPLPMLPSLASDARGHGIHLIYILQSLAQTEMRWGKMEATTLLDNAAMTLVMGGLKDIDALRRFSELLGDVELEEVSTSQNSQSWQSRSTSSVRREKRILRPEEIRSLDPGQALLLFRHAPGMLADMTDWGRRPDADRLRAGEQATRARRTGTPLGGRP